MSRWDSADLKLKKFLRKIEKSAESKKDKASEKLHRKYSMVRLPPVILRPTKATSLEQLQLKYDSGNVNMYVLGEKN